MELKGKNISFKYRNNKQILKDLNISIKSGEIKGLVGNSGSGKSTLSKILAGYIYKNKFDGEVTIDGLPIPKKGFNPVQLIFQHPEKVMNPKWKMKDILFESWDVDDNLIEEFGIQKFWFDRWPNELSGGELQRFSVLRAFSPNTQFLIADEMTTMLDAITQVQICDTVINIVKKRNIGMLLVSHDKELINKICDNIVYLEDINNI